MKPINNYIKEELLLEYIIGKCINYKVKFDLSNHGDERQSRDNKNNKFISKREISFSLYKVARQIRENFDEKIINENDIIGIIDKSRNIPYNCICAIELENESIILKIITHEYKKDFIFKNCKKIFSTYKSDKEIDKEYKPSNII